MAGYEISYEQPPEGTFDIVIPQGVEVVDKRPGAEPVDEPAWLVDEKLADSQFKSARYALADSDYEKAVNLFESVVAIQPMRNWAWFWMGRAYYELGQYEEAIEAYSKVIDMMDVAYCHFARGLAYAMNGMDSAAREDITQALPSMMRTLRYIDAANMFDYADNPRHRGYEPNEQARLAKMINRLRMATGQNFGFDPDASPQEIEEVISAWENWFETSGDINVDPDAELVIVPGPLSPM
jgi:tetratricopeptide (TPR) repeat protein